MAVSTELLRELTLVKPGDPVTEVASSARMNAIMALIKALVRGDHIVTGPNLRKKSQDGWVTLDAAEVKGSRGGGEPFPFEVYKVGKVDTSEGDALSIRPGVMADIVPTLYSEALDADPAPQYIPPVGEFSFLLKLSITRTDSGNYYRTEIGESEVVTDNDSDVIGDISGGGSGEVPTGHMIWDDSDQLTGHFYLKIADISTEIRNSNVYVTDIVQVLFDQYRTFFIAGDTAVVL